jgi:hypothetical protein
MSQILILLNKVAQYLGHLCAISDEQAAACASVPSLQAAWMAAGVKKNEEYAAQGRPEFFGRAGWAFYPIRPSRFYFPWVDPREEECYPDVWGVSHTSGTGRIVIRACDDYHKHGNGVISQPRAVFELWAGPSGEDDSPRKMVAIVATEGCGEIIWEVVEDNLAEEDLGSRADRLDFLAWLSGFISERNLTDETRVINRVKASHAAYMREAEAKQAEAEARWAERVAQGAAARAAAKAAAAEAEA